jgi:hypothetical protein
MGAKVRPDRIVSQVAAARLDVFQDGHHGVSLTLYPSPGHWACARPIEDILRQDARIVGGAHTHQ